MLEEGKGDAGASPPEPPGPGPDEAPARASADRRAAGRSPPRWPILAVLAAAVIVPALFWKQVWFGETLSDEEIRRRLTNPESSRHVQHACEQISRRMRSDPRSATQFYDLLVTLADHRDPQIRYVVAWCMGEDDRRHPPFHRSLLRLVADGSPKVRYNAAVALVRLGDPSGRPVLREMLSPCVVAATWEGPEGSGTVVDILSDGDRVDPLMRLALVDAGGDDPRPVLAPLGGLVGEVVVGIGDRIRKGDPVCVIKPKLQRVWAALRALALVGEPNDLEHVERFFEPGARFSRGERKYIGTQARLTADAIRMRDPSTGPGSGPEFIDKEREKSKQ